MKLFSPKLEKALLSRVRLELRKVPALRKEAKRLARRRQMSATGIFSAALFGGFWAFGLNRVAERGDLGAQLAYCTVSSFVLIALLVIMAYSKLSQPSDANALCNLPISGRHIQKREWSLFFRKSTMLIGTFMILFGLIALINRMGIYEWLAIPFLAVIQWMISLVSAVLLAGYGRGFGSRLVPFCGLLGLVLLIFIAVAPRWAPFGYELFRSLGEMPYWIFPTGWTSFLLLQLKAGNFGLMTLGLLIVVSYCLVFRSALEKLLSSPSLSSLSFKSNPTFVDEETYDTLVAELPSDVSELSRPLMPRTEIEDSIYDRSFLKPNYPVALSWVDRINAQFFNPREKMLVGILGMMSGLTKQWKRAAIFVCALLFYARFVSYEPPVIVYMLMSLIVVGFGLPLWNPVSRAFASSTFSGANIPWYAGFPIGFQDLSRLIFKINFLRFTAFTPLLLGFGMGTAMIYKIDSQLAFYFTLKALALFAVFLPARIILFFTKSTKETTRGGTKVTMALLFVVFLALLFVGFGAAFLFVTEVGAALLCGAIASAISLLFYFGYRWLFNRGRVDLMYVST